MHALKGRKYYACTEERSQKRREIMVTITRRDLCRLALLSLMVAFDGRSYILLLVFQDEKLLFAEIQSIQDSPSQRYASRRESGSKHEGLQCKQ